MIMPITICRINIEKTEDNWLISMTKRIFYDKAFFFPTVSKHFGQFFNFRIFIEIFIYEVKKTSKFLVLGLYLLKKYQ